MAATRKPYAAKHRGPDQPGDFYNSRGEGRRQPDKHATPATPRKKKPKAAPVSATPVTAPIGRPARRPETERSRATREQATEYARRAAIRSGTTKPTVTGGTLAGGLGGAAAGAAVAGPPGAAVGGGIGAVGGALGGARAKKAYKAALRDPISGRMRKALVAEFLVCMVIAALSPLTDKRKDEKPGAFMKRMSAIMGLFLILALISGLGRTAGKISTGLGGLVTVGLVVSERDLFVKLATIFGSTDDAPGPGTGPGSEGPIGALGGGASVGGINAGEAGGGGLGGAAGVL